jgi:hypothetical protein
VAKGDEQQRCMQGRQTVRRVRDPTYSCQVRSGCPVLAMPHELDQFLACWVDGHAQQAMS